MIDSSPDSPHSLIERLGFLNIFSLVELSFDIVTCGEERS